MSRDRDTPAPAGDDYVRCGLNATLADLSGAELARLRAARARALAAPRTATGGRFGRSPWWTSAALAAAAVLLVTLNLRLARPDSGHGPALDAELMRSAATLEMLEDLEFYEWLDSGATG